MNNSIFSFNCIGIVTDIIIPINRVVKQIFVFKMSNNCCLPTKCDLKGAKLSHVTDEDLIKLSGFVASQVESWWNDLCWLIESHDANVKSCWISNIQFTGDNSTLKSKLTASLFVWLRLVCCFFSVNIIKLARNILSFLGLVIGVMQWSRPCPGFCKMC